MKKYKTPLGGMLLVENREMLPILKIWATTKIGSIRLVEVRDENRKNSS